MNIFNQVAFGNQYFSLRPPASPQAHLPLTREISDQFVSIKSENPVFQNKTLAALKFAGLRLVRVEERESPRSDILATHPIREGIKVYYLSEGSLDWEIDDNAKLIPEGHSDKDHELAAKSEGIEDAEHFTDGCLAYPIKTDKKGFLVIILTNDDLLALTEFLNWARNEYPDTQPSANPKKASLRSV